MCELLRSRNTVIGVPVDGGWRRLKLPRSTVDNRVLTYVNRISAIVNRVEPRWTAV